ncbi:hypothetical protein ABPG74_006607 [Tetrahymena malaccensis]
MNSDLLCDIHNNYPIFHIDLKGGSNKKLLCIKCISGQKMEKNFLLIPEVINFDGNLVLENWPPLSDELLRQKIISLSNQKTEDLNSQILDFYDKFIQEVNQILEEKKKEQLIQASKIYEFRDKLIDQYSQMASIDKIKQCFAQENKQLNKIEKDLQNQIDSQHTKTDEYTSILSFMMQQYELISQLDIAKPIEIKQNILQILKIINLIPQNNLDCENEYNIFNISANQQKLNKQNEINIKDNQIIDNLIKELDFCNQNLIKFIHQNNWQQDDFLINQQTLTIQNQINSTQLLKDNHLILYQSLHSIMQNIQQFEQNDVKTFNQVYYNQKSQNNIFISPKQIQKTDNSLLARFQFEAKFQVEKIDKKSGNSYCLIDYLLKPEKKYFFKINFHKNNYLSDFKVGLISDQDKKQFLDQTGNIWNLQDFFLSLAERQRPENERKSVGAFKITVCIIDKTFIITDCANLSVTKNIKKELIKSDGKYYFGFQFQSNQQGDKLEIYECQEQD